MPTDARLTDLLAAIAAGDEAAFERLFRTWYGRLSGYAMRLIGDADKGEDAVQEVFVALWRGRDSLPEAEALPAYLHRAVRNRALNQLRGRRTEELSEDGAGAPSIPPAADTDLSAEELMAAVEAALCALPPRTEEVFRLSREGGLSYPEIAGTLEISVKTVETLMGRALSTLRATLRPRLTEPD